MYLLFNLDCSINMQWSGIIVLTLLKYKLFSSENIPAIVVLQLHTIEKAQNEKNAIFVEKIQIELG